MVFLEEKWTPKVEQLKFPTSRPPFSTDYGRKGLFVHLLCFWVSTLLESNIFAPENRPKLPQKETIVFQPSIFRCELLVAGRVSFMWVFMG